MHVLITVSEINNIIVGVCTYVCSWSVFFFSIFLIAAPLLIIIFITSIFNYNTFIKFIVNLTGKITCLLLFIFYILSMFMYLIEIIKKT
jgi:hypothetical protein